MSIPVSGADLHRDTPDRHPVLFERPGASPILGSISMPFAGGRNPHTDSVVGALNSWLISFGMLEPGTASHRAVERAEFHELTGLVYRRESREDLLLATHFVVALFFFDDMVDARGSIIGCQPELLRRVTELMMDAVRHANAPARELSASEWPLPAGERHKLAAIARGLADVTRRLRDDQRPPLDAFIREMEEYFRGTVIEAFSRRTRAFADLEAYEQARLKFGAMDACIELGALLRGLNPSPSSRRHPAYRRMVRACNLCVSYVNDLFSYKKEYALGEVSNLVMVIEKADMLPHAQAFAKACDICDRVVAEYLADKRRCLTVDADALAMTELLESWMRGHYDWYMGRTARYVDALSTHPGASPLRQLGD